MANLASIRSTPNQLAFAHRDDTPHHLVDMLATISAVVDKSLPSTGGAAEDSHNVLPAFLGKKLSKPIRDSMVSHSADGIFAMRQGDWKYVEGKPAKPVDRVPKARAGEMKQQLYNLRDDPREEKNVIAEHREIAAKLQDLLSTQRAQGRSRKQ